MNTEADMDTLRLASTAWLIHDDHSGILVDSGRQTNAVSLLKTINRLKISLPLIFLTHTHYDHSRGAEAVRRATGAKVIVSSKEAQYLRQGFTPVPKGTNEISKVLGKAAHTLGSKTHEQYRPVTEDIIEIEDESSLREYGFDAKVISLGAHTAGSIGLILDNCIFVGDTVFSAGNLIYPPFADIPEEIPDAWKKIISSGASYICPGHGGKIPMSILERKYHLMYNKKSGTSPLS